MEIQPTSMYTGPVGTIMNDIEPVQATNARVTEEPPKKTSPGESLNSEQVKQMVKEIRGQLSSVNISLDFAPYGKDNEKMAVVVSDKDTGKVIREIPPEELQNLYVKMNELIGIIFNHRV